MKHNFFESKASLSILAMIQALELLRSSREDKKKLNDSENKVIPTETLLENARTRDGVLKMGKK